MKQPFLIIALFLITYSGISQINIPDSTASETSRPDTIILDTTTSDAIILDTIISDATQLSYIDSLVLYSFFPELNTIYQNKIITVSLCAGVGVFGVGGGLIKNLGIDTHGAYKVLFTLSGVCAVLWAIVEIKNIIQIKKIRDGSGNILFTPNGVIVKF